MFDFCRQSSEGFIQIMQRDPREREAQYLNFTTQRPGDLFYTPRLVAHGTLILNTASLAVLSGWDAGTSSYQQVFSHTWDEYAFGVRRGKWRGVFRTKSTSITGVGVLFFNRPPRQ